MGILFSSCLVGEHTVINTDNTSRNNSNNFNPEESRILREWNYSIPVHSTDKSFENLKEEKQRQEKKVSSCYRTMIVRHGYFRNYTHSKGILYIIAIIYVISCSFVSIFQPLIFVCKDISILNDYENPGYAFAQPCHHERRIELLYLTPEECAFGRRIVISAILGAMIGWERRQADRPAGIRTMSVVSLGACLFSICGTFAFIDGPMGWDASRISAAIPSGVGFLGAGIIWKQTDKETNSQSVHGLTTAASLWLSAAVGIACSGELYFAASFAIAVMMILLRFGPRIIVGEEEARTLKSSERDDHYDEEESTPSLGSDFVSADVKKRSYQSVTFEEESTQRKITSPRSSSTANFASIRE